MTVLIADDESIARAGMRDMLAGLEWLRVIGEASNGPAAVDAINRLKPDLVFLDIQMPGLLGTDVIRHITHPAVRDFYNGVRSACGFSIRAGCC